MTKRKPWAYLAIGGVLAVGLSSAAFAAELTDSNADSANPAALHASDHASSVATAVLDALTGGSNPSTVAQHASNTNPANDSASKTCSALTGLIVNC